MNEALAALVRRHDPDRFLTALFAPADKRDALLVLYAFNHELARAREVVSEPPLALIRLQWWREVVEGASRAHEVASPLSAALSDGRLDRDLLLPLIEARETQVYAEFPTLDAWRDWVHAGAGGLAVAAAAALGADAPEALRPFGAAYGVAGLLRSTAVLARHGLCLLPADLLHRYRLSPEAFTQQPDSPAAQAVLQATAEEGRALLQEASRIRVPRAVLPAGLPAVLAGRDLRRWPIVVRERSLGDKSAVVSAWIRGRMGRP